MGVLLDKKRFCQYGVMLFFLLALAVKSDTVQGSAVDSAQVLLINQQYGNARELLNRHLQSFPNDIKALYLVVAVEQTRILDYESYMIDGQAFLAMADSVLARLERQGRALKGKDSIACLFYIANVHGGIGVIHAKNGNWFDGVKHAMNSVSLLKQVRKSRPDLIAANLGLGVFDYYLSTSLKWLPFVDGKSDQGLVLIEKATKAEFPYNYAAKNSLCWILIEKQQYERADSIAKSVLNDVPDNTIFLRIRTMLALWSGKHKRAIELATRLQSISSSRSPVNWSDLVSAHTALVCSYDKLGMSKDAVAAADALLSRAIPAPYTEVPHMKKNLKIIEEIRTGQSSAPSSRGSSLPKK